VLKHDSASKSHDDIGGWKIIAVCAFPLNGPSHRRALPDFVRQPQGEHHFFLAVRHSDLSVSTEAVRDRLNSSNPIFNDKARFEISMLDKHCCVRLLCNPLLDYGFIIAASLHIIMEKKLRTV
jgi:hypothetical protein